LKTHLSRSKTLFNKSTDSLTAFLGSMSLKEINKYDKYKQLNDDKQLNNDHQLLHGSFCKYIIETILSIDSLSSTSYHNYITNTIQKDEKKNKQFIEYSKTEDATDIYETIDKLMKRGLNSLKMIDNDIKGNLELASYCDNFLRTAENEINNNGSGYRKITSKIKMIRDEFPAIIVSQLLKAIEMNSYEAKQRFPRLLQIVKIYDDKSDGKLMETFIEKSKMIPCWMFLSWLSQMTALLDKPEGKTVYRIIDDISNEYPQALVYPLRISLETFKLKTIDHQKNSFLKRIESKTKQITIVNQFIAQLDRLSNPDLVFRDYVTDILEELKKLNNQNVYKIMSEMYTTLFDFNSDKSSSSSLDSNEKVGNIHKLFSTKFKAKFDEEFGVECANIKMLSNKQIEMKLKRLCSGGEMNEFSKTLKDGNIGDYSPWLKSFKRNIGRDLEIPGQYTGKMKPLPEYHIRIESFDERIFVYNSLRRPKRITIRGTDQKEHRFIVKGGEDQRQDERIETLFELVNDLLAADSRCYKRNLHISTYHVYPLKSKLALIEWLPETVTLKEAIMHARNEEEVKLWDNLTTNPDYAYSKYIEEATQSDATSPNQHLTWSQKYLPVYKKFTRQKVVETFEEIENLVPWDLLRRSIKSIAATTEGYFVLRNQFIMTYAVASACQYILGNTIYFKHKITKHLHSRSILKLFFSFF
jgi:DNA-dependent protein kinase catalytic subunit